MLESRLSINIIIQTIIVMLLWSLCFPLIIAGGDTTPPFYFSGLRALLAGFGLLVLAFYYKRALPQTAKHWVIIAAIGISATSIGFWGMFIAGNVLPAGVATVVANAQPLIAIPLAILILNEKLNARIAIGALIGFSGIIIIALAGQAESKIGIYNTGIMYVLLGASGIAVSNVLLKIIAGKVDVLMAMGWQLFIGSIPLLIMAFYTESFSSIDWSPSLIFVLLVLSLLGTSVAFALWFNVLRYVELIRLNIFTFLTPIFGILIGMLFLGEQITLFLAIGIGLSFVGIWQVTRRTLTDQ